MKTIEAGVYTFDREKTKSDYESAIKFKSKTYTVRIYCYKKNAKGKLIAQAAKFKIIAKVTTDLEVVIQQAEVVAKKLNEGFEYKTKSMIC